MPWFVTLEAPLQGRLRAGRGRSSNWAAAPFVRPHYPSPALSQGLILCIRPPIVSTEQESVSSVHLIQPESAGSVAPSGASQGTDVQNSQGNLLSASRRSNSGTPQSLANSGASLSMRRL
jgi:hypothetical protein